MMNETHIQIICDLLQVKSWQINNTIKLLSEGATVPFISRYRKEATGTLDEVQVKSIQDEVKRLGEIEKRRAFILETIEEQGKLTDSLKHKITKTFDLVELEDLYLPYKKKRLTRATKARQKGLEPLATTLLQDQHSNAVSALAKKYINDEVSSEAEALAGARDIIAEWINEDARSREMVRQLFAKEAMVKAKLVKSKESEAFKYKDYFEFSEALKKIPSHRLLAIRRGEDEGFLRVSISPDEEEAIYRLNRKWLKREGGAADQVELAIGEAYKRLLSTSIETEFRNSSKVIADAEAIEVFSSNLRQLLLDAPLGEKATLALDPGFRTGCKVVVLDNKGKLLENATIYPHPPQMKVNESASIIRGLAYKYGVEAVAVGNGTASRETLDFVGKVDFDRKPEVYSVNESGASIYSASDIAREEFPNYDITVRGAVSIGRRLMDPLAELVKIDPKSIGVGQYQHDVNQVHLRTSLDTVVESCVNAVGINLNTASKHLLTYISGLGPKLAENIVNYRAENGAFTSRTELKKVARMGGKAFEQAAGFLRIRQAKNPLDNTAVHPERYALVKQMAKDLKCSIQDLIDQKDLRDQLDLNKYIAEDIGLPTLKDILLELTKPGLDPRGAAQPFEFAQGITKLDDVYEGMVLPGIINNITKFGAFVDIGIKESGLVHISQMANRFIKDPNEVVKLNQKVQVRVLEVDRKRGRVSLSMKDA